MSRFNAWLVDHPWTAAAVVLAVTVITAIQIRHLEIDTSAEGLMVEKDPAKDFYEETKKRFGSDQLTIVLLKADNVFTPEVLGAVRKISDALERTEGVTRVESLTTVKNIKGRGDTLNTDPLIDVAIPRESAELQEIRADALGNRVFVGNVVSKDSRAAAINVYTEPKAGDKEFNKRFSGRVETLLREHSLPGMSAYQIGSAYTKVTYAEYLQGDQVRLVPMSIGVLFVILLIAFRAFQGVVIPLVTGVLSIFWSLGLMATAGIPINTLTVIIPALLISIGFTEDVHMISEYHHLLGEGHDKDRAIRTMLDQSSAAVLITTGTTVLGFGSLIFTDITILIQFGYASSMGLIANYVVTITVLPIALRLWPVPRRLRTAAFQDESVHGLIPRLLARLGAFNLQYRVPIAIVAIAVTGASLYGWYRLKVNTDFISYFPENSEIRQRTKDIHERLTGAVTFFIVVDTGREDGVKEPEVLRRIAGLQDFLADTGRVDKTVSVADYVRKMHREMNDGNASHEVVPDSREEIAQYLLTLDGPELRKYIDFNASAANVVIRHNITSSWELSGLLERVKQHVATNFSENVTVRPTGETILINNAADYMAINEVTSFSFTFVVVGIIHSLLFFSLKAGFLSLIPNVIPIITVYGVMGLLGIPLNTGTALIATIAIAIAVDDTVHHMVTYSRELNKHHDQRIAMFNTLRSQGRPIIYVSLALAGGFLVLIFSNFVPTFYFGVLSAFVMVIAMVGELMLTPILMYSIRLVTLWDLLLVRMDRDVIRSAPLFRDFSRWEMRKIVLLGALRSYSPGEALVRYGESGTEMNMIVQGRVRVVGRAADGSEHVLARLGPGMVVGEAAAVSGGTRMADVIAEEPTDTLRLDMPVLERLRLRFPYTGAKLFRNIARVLAERLGGGRPPMEQGKA